MTPLDPAAVTYPLETAQDDELAQLRAQVAVLQAQVPAAAPGAPGATAVSSPVESPPPASSVPPVGSIVVRTHVPPGAEGEVNSYGIVVHDADDVAQVAWFAAITSLPGDELSKIG
jgi:hypothetical protein